MDKFDNCPHNDKLKFTFLKRFKMCKMSKMNESRETSISVVIGMNYSLKSK